MTSGRTLITNSKYKKKTNAEQEIIKALYNKILKTSHRMTINYDLLIEMEILCPQKYKKKNYLN